MTALPESAVTAGRFQAADDVLDGWYVRNDDAPAIWEYVEPVAETHPVSDVAVGWVIAGSSSHIAQWCEVLSIEDHFEAAEVTFSLRHVRTGQLGTARCHKSDPIGRVMPRDING